MDLHQILTSRSNETYQAVKTLNGGLLIITIIKSIVGLFMSFPHTPVYIVYSTVLANEGIIQTIPQSLNRRNQNGISHHELQSVHKKFVFVFLNLKTLESNNQYGLRSLTNLNTCSVWISLFYCIFHEAFEYLCIIVTNH